MPVYVEHKESGDFFLLIGTGYGSFQSDTEGIFTLKKGTFQMVSLCDKNGNIGWIRSDKIRVINVDGIDLKDMDDLGEFNLPL